NMGPPRARFVVSIAGAVALAAAQWLGHEFPLPSRERAGRGGEHFHPLPRPLSHQGRGECTSEHNCIGVETSIIANPPTTRACPSPPATAAAAGCARRR